MEQDFADIAISPHFNVRRAIVTIAVAAARARAPLTPDDELRLRTLCSLNPLFATDTDSDEAALWVFADDTSAAFGIEACKRAAQALSPALRETAFSITCDLLLAKNQLGSPEIDLLDRVATCLDIAREAAQPIIQVAVIRNRGLE